MGNDDIYNVGKEFDKTLFLFVKQRVLRVPRGMDLIAKNSRTWQPNVTLQLPIICFTRGLFVGYFSRASRKLVMNCANSSLKLNSSPISYTYPLQINLHTYRKMIEEITIKFGTKLKPTQHSWKSQLYNQFVCMHLDKSLNMFYRSHFIWIALNINTFF